MRLFIKLYDAVVFGLAVLSGLMLVWLMIAIIVSVLQRNFGMQPAAWLFVSTEYFMFYLTLLGAPWLLRHRGHVYIELLTAAMPKPVLNIFSRFVSLLCALVCAFMAYKGAELVGLNIERTDLDVRAYYFPTWLLNIAFPISFGLMAIEFMRFVVGKEILHTGEAGLKE
jgi:TRAP-type C4-dicarboxylate transport system permease small subunit